VTTVQAAVAGGAARLAAAGVPDAATDARWLMAHALGVDPGRLLLVAGDPLPAAAAQVYDGMLSARCARQPVAQITGTRAFWGRRFTVTPDVLDPRPETETLVALALAEPFARVLDLGTGSGCIVVTLLAERAQARGVGADISPAALAVTGANALRHGVADRLILTPSDWFADLGGSYDLIVANPPYIAASEMPGLDPEVRDWEPRHALTDGADGLTAYRTIAAQAPAHLVPGGRLIVEIGAAQGPAVADLFRDAGLSDVSVHADLAGRDRVVSARCGASPAQIRLKPPPVRA
jgi:release factor glutamine methyltransferase